MAANNSVNISIDDGIPLDFLAEMHVAMDCLPVDEEEANRIIAEKLRKEQQERNVERVRQFNNAWNIQPIDCAEPTLRRVVPHSSSAKRPLEKVSVRDPRIVARSTQSLLEHGANRRPPYTGIVQLQPDDKHQLDAVIHERALTRLHSSNMHENPEAVFEDEEQLHPQTAQHSRDTGRTRSRSRRSRRRRKRARSRSRHRSPSYSRSRSSSPSSDHSHSTVESHGRSSSRATNVDPATMLQSMMAMTMQMFNQNGTFLNGKNTPMVLPNRAPFPAVDPLPGMMMDDASPFVPSALRNMFANQMATTRATQAEEGTHVASDLNTVIIDDDDQPNQQPKYDVSTELFLEGKLSFTDFLSMKPSARGDQIAPVDPKVPKRIKEAITILEQQDTNKRSARFLYVPPTFYGSDNNKDEHQRSPLIWSNESVLFPFSSRAKEVKQCQPFRNVNAKLRELIEKLGLDEGIVSQQLKKVMRGTTDEQNANNRCTSDTGALSSSSRIQAITTLSAKPGGSAKVRHLIDRAVQTDGYACLQCVARNNKTFISIPTQTLPPAMRKDTEVQTSGPPLSTPNSISLDGLNANQIETVDAIVRFIRARQLAGSIESVQHALRNDRVTAPGMTPTIQQNAQRLLSQVKADLQRSETLASNSSAHYGNFHMPHASTQMPQQYDSRFRHPGSGITRTFHTTATTMSEQIIPAGFENQPAMSKKMKKRLKLQQQHQQQRW